MDTIRGNREEWFVAPAVIKGNRIEATMPPGATHACFSLRDANGYLISSEELPAVVDVGHHMKDSELLENGYAFKPGLYALIKLGERAAKADAESTKLVAAIALARAAYIAESLSDDAYCDVIRDLRAAIRNQAGTPEAQHPLLNRFPTDPLF